MEQFLYGVVGVIAQFHSYILSLNNNYEASFNDKELHFLVLGIVGIILVFIAHPIFKWLANTGHVMVITFMYVLTIMIVIAFAIEIGQGATGTGVMEFDDIVYGIGGFLAMFIVFMVIRGIYHLIKRWVTKDDDEWYS
ncbi:MAG: hypothetical protein Q4C80_04995 [Bacillota bacterium]|nr:hypothetical protein [Bacillota bacterium]